MQIILLERIEKLGQMGDLVNVKTGYARNFLIPQGKALRANKANMERFEAERAQREASNLELRKDAETEAAKMQDLAVSMVRAASEMGQLFGSVTSRDIAEAVTEAGFTIRERNQGDYGSINQNARSYRNAYPPSSRSIDYRCRECCSLTCRSRNPAENRRRRHR